MGIEQNHPLYEEWIGRWVSCRDAVSGEVAVKKKGVKYLPKLDKMKDSTYRNYLQRASFSGLPGSIVDAISGVMFVKNPEVSVNDKIATDNIDGNGTTLIGFHQYVVRELLVSSRPGLWVNWDDSRKMPYVKIIPPEAVVNWSPSDKGLQFVVWEETVYASTEDDPYEMEEQTVRIELYIDNGVYQIRRHHKVPEADSEHEWQVLEEPVTPLKRGGGSWDSIPFRFCTLDGLRTEIHEPEIEDICGLEYKRYLESADIEWGGHFACLPTPVFTGWNKQDNDPIPLGPTGGVVLPQADAKAYMLQYDGKGISVLRELREDKREEIIALGFAYLEKEGVETAEATRLRLAGGTAPLTRLANASVLCVHWTLETMHEFAQLGTPFVYDMDKNFIPESLSPQALKELFAVYMGGGMSRQVFLAQIQRGGMYPEGHTIEDEMELIDNAQPAFTEE